MTHHRFLSGASRVARVALWRIAKAVAGPWAGNPVGPDTAQCFNAAVVDFSWSIPNAGITLDVDSAQCFNVSVR